MVKAKKSLGQNFLKDAKIINQIIEAAELTKEDIILEVGPGKGVLTQALLERSKELFAIELDDRLIPILSEKFSQFDNFKLIHADALLVEPPQEPYKIVANIPYYITSPLLNHFLLEQFESGNPPKMIVFMVQKEVAEKILAKKEKHSVLSLQVHLFGDPELVCIVPSSAFDPQPKVESAVIKIKVHEKAKLDVDLSKFFKFIKAAFIQKRKKIANNLMSYMNSEASEIKSTLKALGINPDIRAEDLTLEEWAKLFHELH